MKKKTVDVKSSRKNKKPETPGGNWTGPNNEDLGPKGEKTRCKVGTVEYDIYDSLPEMQTAIGDAKILALSNTQLATNAKNEARALAVGGQTSTSLRNKALNKIISTPDLFALLAATAGNQEAQDALFTEVIDGIKEEEGIEDESEALEEATV